ncbi:MAG: OmpA domain-containing protein [Candidatus Peregrinibacteria bacterium Greene0416_19]|nr:MAG: OmpA domain-containing protein [Candidatus Peregrinibacteria bacterium Greene0416_19]
MDINLRIRHLPLLLLVLAGALGIGVWGYDLRGEALNGRMLLSKPKQIEWLIIDADALHEGVTLPARTYVIIRLPYDIGPVPEQGLGGASSSSDAIASLETNMEGVETGTPGQLTPDGNPLPVPPPRDPEIVREVLFGRQGYNVRYWGYVFPQRREDGSIEKSTEAGLPGKMFLSEAERSYRRKKQQESRSPYTPDDPPTQFQLENEGRALGRIRHQVEVFRGATEIFVIANRELLIGSDRDGDRLNSTLEQKEGTDPQNPDTDDDGIMDGAEVFDLKTNPTMRDTDRDGLIDSIEVHGHNHIGPGDTDPNKKDSDGDGKCDGLCDEANFKRSCADFPHPDNPTDPTDDCKAPKSQWVGEDKNLNGQVDAGETDPTKRDSDGDGIFDMQEYYDCLLQGKGDCS